ncbi:MAG TPA: cysteine peptidase family C39 domain-containing protein [Planctomycetota bacterium]|jgi:predicted double-glycine peptidase
MNPEALFLLVLLWTLTAAAAWGGWRVGRVPKLPATLVAAAVCGVLVLGAWTAKHPAWLPEPLVCRWSVYLYGSWFAPLGALLFLIGARQAQARYDAANQPRLARRQVAAFALLTGVVLGAASNPLLGAPRLNECAGDPTSNVDADDVVHQTTGYTCGASACATLLRMTGIERHATEAELVPKVMTRRFGGATALGMAVGLKEIVQPKGWRVRIVEVDLKALARLRKPCVCAIRYNVICDHAVVVCKVDPERGVQVADPLGGLSWWSLTQFQERFQNEVIAVYRESPFESGERGAVEWRLAETVTSELL